MIDWLVDEEPVGLVFPSFFRLASQRPEAKSILILVVFDGPSESAL
jgi:hypothetical protein